MKGGLSKSSHVQDKCPFPTTLNETEAETHPPPFRHKKGEMETPKVTDKMCQKVVPIALRFPNAN